MKRSLLFGVMSVVGLNMTAQTPDLEIKKDLSSSLISSARNFTEANGVDTIMLPMNAAGDFTLEVTGKVSSAVGRGLDIEARKNDGTGFRTSVSSSKLYWSAPLANMSSKTFSTTAEQTLRYAVKGKEVHVYQNGTYLFSNDLVDINDIVNDTEVAASGTYEGDNLVADWAGKTGDNSGLPTAYGWDCDKPANWNTPNSGGVRYKCLLLNGWKIFNVETTHEQCRPCVHAGRIDMHIIQ